MLLAFVQVNLRVIRQVEVFQHQTAAIANDEGDQVAKYAEP